MTFYEECIKVVNDELNNFKFGKISSVRLISEEELIKEVFSKVCNSFPYPPIAFTLANTTTIDSGDNSYSFKNEIFIRLNGLEFLRKSNYKEYYKNIVKTYGKFLNSMGIELTEETYFIIKLLSEYGYNEYLDKFNYFGKSFNRVMDITESYYIMLNLLFDFDNVYDEEESEIINSFSHPSKLYCIKYAMENFMLIWNKVKHFI